MRNIKYLVVHCTGGPATQQLKDITSYWKSKGWTNPGYHFLIFSDGSEFNLQPIERLSNGVAGFNAVSINVCYVGGMFPNKKLGDTRTEAQKKKLVERLTTLKKSFPKAIIQGHRDFSPDLNGNGIIEHFEFIKVCPGFDAKKEYQNI
jgi:N-acetyl-anhydromuramyl-L-alanine amidase AmpD